MKNISSLLLSAVLAFCLAATNTVTIIPGESFVVETKAYTVYEYYPKCSSSYTSLVDGLKSIGVDSSYTNRKTIATKNGISNYSGTASQNTTLLNKLKAGNLIKSTKEKEMIIIEEKRKVDFHSTQLYINKKEDVDALNEDFESLGLTNKSDYLRGLIMLGLETKKNQERKVSIKEKESLIKLDELSNKINEVKELLNDVGFDDSVYELLEELKKSFDETFMTVIGTVNKVNKKVDFVIKHYDKVLGSIYKLLYSMCLKERVSKKDLESGLLDELPVRFKSN